MARGRKGHKFTFPGYPPDQHEKATLTVLEQAYLLAKDGAG